MDPVIARTREDLKNQARPGDPADNPSFLQRGGLVLRGKDCSGHRDRKKGPGRRSGSVISRRSLGSARGLSRSGMMEEAFIVSNWVPNLAERFEPEDIAVFRRWITTWITNWAACDSFCNHAVGDFIEKYPEFISELKQWTQSDNRWMRRAAAVSLIVPAKHGKFLNDAIEIAALLLTDRDDKVQKGYGWLLKEAEPETY